MKMPFFALIGFLVLFSISDSYAQFNAKGVKKSNKRIGAYRGGKSTWKQNAYNTVGFSLNALNYYGDLSPTPKKISTDISFTKPGFGLSFSRRMGPRYTLQAQFMYGTLKGADTESANKDDLSNGIFRYKRNLSFRNQIKELTVVGIFDLFENEATYMSRVQWTPYVFAGVSAFLHNPQALAPATDLQGNPLSQAGQWVDLRPLGTEGQYSTLAPTDVNYGIKPYSLLQIAIPFGFGARFRLNEAMDISADLGFRYCFTDYLDDVSQNYVNLSTLKSPLAQAMSYRTNELFNNNPPNPSPSGIPGVSVENGYGSEQVHNNRGTKKYNDFYMVTSVRLTYIISPSYHKAKFR